ncbi:hypothetical protein [Neorhizobium sp. DAR64861/K0K2]|uniref:hypothetical protein n=1 Tax=unclassified Neorhizobium TaxID=2629175 RepID=UPI003D27F71A
MSSTLRIIIIFAIVTAIIGAATWLYKAGGADTLNSIERQNSEAGTASDRARSRFDECFDAGGVFDSSSGKCRRP